MRLLFLTNYFPPHHLGGYEELCAEVVHGLERRGHHITVLTSHRGAHNGTGVQDGVLRLLSPVVDVEPFGPTLNFFLGRRQRLEQNLRCLRQTVSEVKPDNVLVWGAWNLSRQLLAAAEGLRPELVYYLADYWPELPDAYALHWQEPARRSYTRLPKALLSRVARGVLGAETPLPRLEFRNAICVSRAVRQQLEHSGVLPHGAAVIYNGIDCDTYAGAPAWQRRDARRLLLAGRLCPDKGVETAIQAVGLLNARGIPVNLDLVGNVDREYECKLRRLCDAQNVGECVTFCGRAARDEMPGILKQHGILLVPSIWADPMPRIVQEGMAAGLVVIASRIGGIPEIVEDGVNGLLCTPGDAGSLASQMQKAVQPDFPGQSITAAAVRTVRECFDISRMLDELEAYLDKVSRQSL